MFAQRAFSNLYAKLDLDQNTQLEVALKKIPRSTSIPQLSVVLSYNALVFFFFFFSYAAALYIQSLMNTTHYLIQKGEQPDYSLVFFNHGTVGVALGAVVINFFAIVPIIFMFDEINDEFFKYRKLASILESGLFFYLGIFYVNFVTLVKVKQIRQEIFATEPEE